MDKKKRLYIILLTVSFIFLFGLIACILVFENFSFCVDQVIISEAPLLPNSKLLNKWAKSDKDNKFYLSIYLFNVTNSYDVMTKKTKPILKEIGPIVYDEKRNLTILGWNKKSTLMHFTLNKKYFHNDDLSKFSLDDKITILNVPLIGLYSMIDKIIDDRDLSPFFKRMFFMSLNEIIKKRNLLFINKKISELLFDGYMDDLIEVINIIKKIIKIVIPPTFGKNGKFSLLSYRNDTDDGLWSVYTGLKNLTNLGRLRYLNYAKSLSCRPGSCGSIYGSDGLIHHPLIKNDETLKVYEPVLNKSIDLFFESDLEYKGIPVKRFVMSNYTYASCKKFKENSCLCPNFEDDIFYYDGILQGASCNYDLPIMFSNPHFYQADNYFLNQTIGLKPNKTLHESFADINPDLGISLNGRKTAQLNMFTRVISKKSDLISELVFPVFWIEEYGNASQTSVNYLNSQLYDKVNVTKKLLVIFICISFISIVLCIGYMAIDKILNYVRNKEEKLITEDQ